MMRSPLVAALTAVAVSGFAGCASSDNPTALAELSPDTEFEFSLSRIETFDEVEISVLATESGRPMSLRHTELEIEPASGGPARVVEMEKEGEGYAAHVTFFDDGEQHLHFRGTVEGHRLEMEVGESEIEVHRRHVILGPYWVEIGLSPAPVLENTQTTIHLFAYTAPGEGAGAPVEGLELELEAHTPDGAVTVLPVIEEEAGEYDSTYRFGEAGDYELHVEITVDGVPEDGEFHIPVLSRDPSETDTDQGGDAGGDHGH